MVEEIISKQELDSDLQKMINDCGFKNTCKLLGMTEKQMLQFRGRI